ncbi:MAG TPA: hypothetical protein VH442_14905 [Micromonosporaceae bacterium]|jgi:hypothetical protein
MARRRAVTRLSASCAVAALICTSACGSEHVPPARVGQPTPAAGIVCEGVDAQATVRALFARLDAGRPVDVTAYFVPPAQFVGWSDPDVGRIAAGRDAGGALTLDALRARLDYLADRITIALITFHNSGAQRGGGGDVFAFTARVQPAPVAATGPGMGHGVVDCATGKITEFVIDRW